MLCRSIYLPTSYGWISKTTGSWVLLFKYVMVNDLEMASCCDMTSANQHRLFYFYLKKTDPPCCVWLCVLDHGNHKELGLCSVTCRWGAVHGGWGRRSLCTTQSGESQKYRGASLDLRSN